MPAMEYESVNPFDGKTMKTFVAITDAQLEHKPAAAQTCYETWRHKTYAERATIVAKAAAIMHERLDDFARLATLEMGKRIEEARGEVQFSSDILASLAIADEGRVRADIELEPLASINGRPKYSRYAPKSGALQPFLDLVKRNAALGAPLAATSLVGNGLKAPIS
jgi:acyl-CoA reductase-like NAD-dependent aldehyde dehydrogenase